MEQFFCMCLAVGQVRESYEREAYESERGLDVKFFTDVEIIEEKSGEIIPISFQGIHSISRGDNLKVSYKTDERGINYASGKYRFFTTLENGKNILINRTCLAEH